MNTMLSQHLWKSTVRSILWKRELGTNIFVGALLALLALNFLSLGIFIDGLLKQLQPGANHVALFNGMLLPYFFLIDLVLRILFQKTPALIIQPYLLLPLTRKQLVRFLLWRSTFSMFNLLPLLVIIPAAFTLIAPRTSFSAAMLWLFSLLCLILSSNFLLFYLEKSLLLQPRRVFVLFLVVIALLMNFVEVFVKLSSVSQQFFQWILDVPYASLLPLAILVLVYTLNIRSLSRALYLDRLMIAPAQSIIGKARLSYLDRFGDVGNYLSLELKLLLRNKRSRSTVYMALAMIPAIILMSGIYVRYLDQYPVPERVPEAINALAVTSSTQRLVTFIVSSSQIPPSAHVYVTGDHQSLGKWNPSFLPLMHQADGSPAGAQSAKAGSWSRSVAFEHGTTIRYIFTLGTWENEIKLPDGKSKDIRSMQVLSDTTIVNLNPRWGDGRIPAMVMIMVVYMGILSTGFLMLVYGQFMFSWESAYFDLLISRPVNFWNYLYAKFLLLQIFGVICLLINGFTAFISWKLLAINATLMLYNAGVNVFALIGWSMLARKRLDLNASIVSTQGKGSSQFLTILPMFILPVVVYLLLNRLGFGEWTLFIFGILGVLGLIFQRALLTVILKYFSKQKYKMAAGFRQM
ncbi:MAG: DUF5687 family protein [bacterium]